MILARAMVLNREVRPCRLRNRVVSVRVPWCIFACNGGAYATVTFTSNSLNSPGAPLTVFSNLFLAGVTIDNTRLEFAGRNGRLSTLLELANV